MLGHCLVHAPCCQRPSALLNGSSPGLADLGPLEIAQTSSANCNGHHKLL